MTGISTLSARPKMVDTSNKLFCQGGGKSKIKHAQARNDECLIKSSKSTLVLGLVPDCAAGDGD